MRMERRRTLLLLDGLEPLQDPPGVNKGRFKDKALATLLTCSSRTRRPCAVDNFAWYLPLRGVWRGD
jgi:hypothetical protein